MGEEEVERRERREGEEGGRGGRERGWEKKKRDSIQGRAARDSK